MDNLVIEKVNDIKKEEVINFLAEESFKLFWKLNKEKLGIDNIDLYKPYYIIEFIEDYSKNPSNIYAAFSDNKVVGAGYMDDSNYLDTLFVDSDYRNNGIGSSILERLINDITTNEVIRVDANIYAINFYKKFNFKLVDGVSNSYFKPMVLERKLK